jgi:hypothetical protein
MQLGCIGVMVLFQVLRATAKLSTTIFYIPLVTTVVHLFDCHGTWGVVSWKCYTGVHLVTSIIAGVVILAFSAFSFIGASRTHTASPIHTGTLSLRLPRAPQAEPLPVSPAPL